MIKCMDWPNQGEVVLLPAMVTPSMADFREEEVTLVEVLGDAQPYPSFEVFLDNCLFFLKESIGARRAPHLSISFKKKARGRSS
jgi:hypothetical protein